MKAERKDIQDDFVLVTQYRNALTVKSLYSNFSQQLEKAWTSIVYCPAQLNDENFEKDSLYYLQRDGVFWKMLKLSYFVNEEQQYLYTYYEFQSNSVHMFAKHGNTFYLMDESMQIKAFSIDSQQKKLRIQGTFDLAQTTKNTWDAYYSQNTLVSSCTIY
mmetsp:Transcript_30433/g.29801  ORF Transcript_30433/g.29801 Transcript_30433/m.29801 type:complete len:160 (-) Transcript_30433:3923-4402(-)